MLQFLDIPDNIDKTEWVPLHGKNGKPVWVRDTASKIANQSGWPDENGFIEPPTIIIKRGYPEWKQAYLNWLDGKTPTSSKEWKKGVVVTSGFPRNWLKRVAKKLFNRCSYYVSRFMLSRIVIERRSFSWNLSRQSR